FRSAVAAAESQCFLQDEALGHELAGRLEMAEGDETRAMRYVRRAMRAYARWGADEKVRALAEEFPSVAPPTSYGAIREAGAEAEVSSALLDMQSLVKVAEALASEVVLERLVEKLLASCLEVAGAERGALVLVEDGEPTVRAIGTSSGAVTHTAKALASSDEVPRRFVSQSLGKTQAIVVEDVARDDALRADDYVKTAGVRCAMAIPIRGRSEIVGVLYLENRLATHAFAPDRVRFLELLSTVIAISLENGLLFDKLRGEVEERRRAEEFVRFLADASVTLAEAARAGRTIEAVAELPVPFLADWCTVDLTSPDGRVSRFPSRDTDPAKDAIVRELAERYPPDIDSQEFPFMALRAGEARLASEVPEELLTAVARDERHAELLRSLGIRSAIAVPLVARGRPIGVLTLFG
ncbi:MAG: GAF domain-containing protein, partial [Polyangiaceae bacterium]|nr:GAF domain-containing protein [Polyangiaceae bacterium]